MSLEMSAEKVQQETSDLNEERPKTTPESESKETWTPPLLVRQNALRGKELLIVVGYYSQPNLKE